MSTTSIRTRRTVTLLVTVGTAVALAWGVPTSASAHPGEFDSETCEQSLTRVWHWPGTLGTGGPVIFSDAYESYVLRQPPCTYPGFAAPSSRDDSRVGHGDPL
jgi:hypothetical protein